MKEFIISFLLGLLIELFFLIRNKMKEDADQTFLIIKEQHLLYRDAERKLFSVSGFTFKNGYRITKTSLGIEINDGKYIKFRLKDDFHGIDDIYKFLSSIHKISE